MGIETLKLSAALLFESSLEVGELVLFERKAARPGMSAELHQILLHSAQRFNNVETSNAASRTAEHSVLSPNHRRRAVKSFNQPLCDNPNHAGVIVRIRNHNAGGQFGERFHLPDNTVLDINFNLLTLEVQCI